jgi:hypothetical protein
MIVRFDEIQVKVEIVEYDLKSSSEWGSLFFPFPIGCGRLLYKLYLELDCDS